MLGILTYFRIRCGSSAPAGRKLPSLATFFTSLLKRVAREAWPALSDPEYQPVKDLRLAITTNAHAVMAPEYEPPKG